MDYKEYEEQARQMQAEAISKGAGNMYKSIRENLRRRKNMNRTIKELNALTDAELNDIGITRGDIGRIARSVIDFHRTVRDNNGE